ncbi:MAG: response regulator, partial [Candidatus Omnitrophota bacterium]|nr:response regulator [Candidatus Omnitrophota bacterium]
AYLKKPIKQSDLLDTMFTVFSKSDENAEKDRLDKRRVDKETKRRFHILLAEDNAVNQLAATRTLEKRGHTVVVAGNGQKAIEAYGKERFDLVLMDVQMPVMDGYQAVAGIRAYEKENDIRTPIIAVTAHTLKGDMEKCLAAGMDDYLSKPLRPQLLFEAIDKWCKATVRGDIDRSKPATPAVQSRYAKPGAEAPPVEIPKDEAPKEEASNPVLSDVLRKDIGLRYAGDDEELYQQIIDIFVEDSPKHVKQLKESFEASNVEQVERLAHLIKGSTANIGAEELKKEALKIEMAAANGDLETGLSHHKAFEDSYKRLMDFLANSPLGKRAA